MQEYKIYQSSYDGGIKGEALGTIVASSASEAVQLCREELGDGPLRAVEICEPTERLTAGAYYDPKLDRTERRPL